MRFPSQVLFAILLAHPALASAPKPAPRQSAPQTLAVAHFAGGCFWSMEKAFEAVPGVKDAISGYSGGSAANPSYEQVSSGMTGHVETVEVRYDPKLTNYDKLLDAYWHHIDPTQDDGQFCDH